MRLDEGCRGRERALLALRGTAHAIQAAVRLCDEYLFSSGWSDRVPVAPDRLSPDGSGTVLGAALLGRHLYSIIMTYESTATLRRAVSWHICALRNHTSKRREPEPYAAHSWGVSAATEAPPDGRPGGPCSVFRPGAMHFTLTLTLEPPLSPTTWSSQKSRTQLYLPASSQRHREAGSTRRRRGSHPDKTSRGSRDPSQRLGCSGAPIWKRCTTSVPCHQTAQYTATSLAVCNSADFARSSEGEEVAPPTSNTMNSTSVIGSSSSISSRLCWT